MKLLVLELVLAEISYSRVCVGLNFLFWSLCWLKSLIRFFVIKSVAEKKKKKKKKKKKIRKLL
jgi:hypothetical protein